MTAAASGISRSDTRQRVEWELPQSSEFKCTRRAIKAHIGKYVTLFGWKKISQQRRSEYPRQPEGRTSIRI